MHNSISYKPTLKFKQSRYKIPNISSPIFDHAASHIILSKANIVQVHNQHLHIMHLTPFLSRGPNRHQPPLSTPLLFTTHWCYNLHELTFSLSSAAQRIIGRTSPRWFLRRTTFSPHLPRKSSCVQRPDNYLWKGSRPLTAISHGDIFLPLPQTILCFFASPRRPINYSLYILTN